MGRLYRTRVYVRRVRSNDIPNGYYKSEISTLWLCTCTIRSQQRRDMQGLRKRIRMARSLELSPLCLKNRNFFPSEHRYYNQEAYKTHLRCSDDDGSIGHLLCELCRKSCYDKTALFTHLQEIANYLQYFQLRHNAILCVKLIQDHFSRHICTTLGIL